jgi:hypothetical protein
LVEHTAPEWQAAMQVLLLAANNGSMMTACIGMMQAIRSDKTVGSQRPPTRATS